MFLQLMIELHFVGASGEKFIPTKTCPAVLFKCKGDCIKVHVVGPSMFLLQRINIGSSKYVYMLHALLVSIQEMGCSKNSVQKHDPYKEKSTMIFVGEGEPPLFILHGEFFSFLFIYLYEFPKTKGVWTWVPDDLVWGSLC